MSKTKKTATTNAKESTEVTNEEKPLETKKSPSKVSSKLREITSSRRQSFEKNLKKKPIPKSLVGNEGIKYYFYFLYVFILIGLLNAVNTNLFNMQYWLDLNGIAYNSVPLIPDDLMDIFFLNFYSFFIAILALLLRVFVATGLAVIAFDDEKDNWIRLVSVVGIVFVIFGVQLIGP